MNDRSMTFLQTLFDNSHDGIYEIDRQGRVVAWNRGAKLPTAKLPILATRTDGRRREALVAIKHADGFCPALLARIIPALEEKKRNMGTIEIFSSLIQRADELMYPSKQAGRNRVTVRE
ncbi:MAG: PAS domain-containing protein [Chloroflexota bacterium]